MSEIITKIEAKRGCGYRKPGGLYLVADGPFSSCGRMPIPLGVCPVCGEGVKPARGWTWVTADLIKGKLDGVCLSKDCPSCPLHDPSKLPFDRAGLLWVGEKFYRSPGQFNEEASRMGISRRIAALPHGFELGKAWVLLAHRFALGSGPAAKAAIFSIFKPERVEYVVTGKETEEEIAKLRERGITPVEVKHLEEGPDEEIDESL